MRAYILFDHDAANTLLPFTYTRPVADVRVGIMTIREKWAQFLNAKIFVKTAAYLQQRFTPLPKGESYIRIAGNLLPDTKLVDAIKALKPREALLSEGNLLAAYTDDISLDKLKTKEVDFPIRKITYLWDIVQLNDWALRQDFEQLTKGRQSQDISEYNKLICPKNIFVEEGAEVSCSIINASTGPVYIGKNAQVMEGNLIRGPFSLGENSLMKMGGHIYGATSVGPKCVIGGEIKNTVFFGHSNKAHDGYLGDAVIGEWCNLGANSSCSNLKNNAGEVRVWTEFLDKYLNAGQKCGLFMADYSRCGIQTMFNTGTVVGVSCNIYGGGFPDKYISSFSWGATANTLTYHFDKAIKDIDAWKKLKGASIEESEIDMLKYIFENIKNSNTAALL